MKKIFKTALNIILSSILFILTFILLIIIPIKKVISEDNVKEIVSHVEIEKLVTNNNEFEKLLELIYEETRKMGISDEIVLKIIDSKEIKNLLGDAASNFMNFIMTGNNQKIINTQDIEVLVGNVIDNINKLQICEIKEKDKNNILKIVHNKATEYSNIIPDTNTIVNNLSVEEKSALNIVHFTLGNELIESIGLTMGIIILFIVLINYSKGKCFKVGTIPIIIASLFTTIISLALLLNPININNNSYIYDILAIGTKFSLKLSGGTLIISLVILIAYIIISSKAKKEENKN